MSKLGFSTQVVRPSALSPAEIAAWHEMMQRTRSLQRAFLAPEFALACERAHDMARVIVFRRNRTPVAFFPFQFAGAGHRLTGAAERIGGSISDHAGIIAVPEFRTEPHLLLTAGRLKALFLTHLCDSQSMFGLPGQDGRIGHVIDLRDGAKQYFANLALTRNDFFQDTRRRLRRAEKTYGPLGFTFNAASEFASARDILTSKRDQYARTGAGDVFDNPDYLAVIESLFSCSSVHCRPIVSVLRAGDHVLARHLGLMSNGVLSYWFPVYDPTARAVSPGRLLLWHILESADEHGVSFIDRGEGDSRAKQDFSTGVQHFGKAYWHRGLIALPARAQVALQWRMRAGADSNPD